jgi:hypothetical protein
MAMEHLEWGRPVAGWRLSLSLDGKEFPTEERIAATIVFQNVSDREQRFGGHGPDFDYTLECTIGDGERVLPTSFGKTMLANRDLVKTTGGVLQANQQIVVELSLTHHLDLSLPGKYQLKVSRQADESASGTPNAPIIVSNTVEFEIKER